jgi:long-chain acyl-CoA synthetase
VSSEEVGRRAAEMSLGLVSLGLEPGDRVAVLSETRLEWALADMAILTAGLVSVPIYPTLTPEGVTHILKDSGSRALFVSDPEQAAKVKELRESTPQFPVIVFDGAERAADALSLEQLCERGRDLAAGDPDLRRRRAAGVEPDQLATLIYTSGTTGTPKGVMLTHHNIVSNVLTVLRLLSITDRDTALSFLPLSHIFERMAGLYTLVHAGVSIAYAESVDSVPQNLLEVRPTLVIGVPRLFEKMYARVLDAATQGGFLKKNLFFWARDVGLRWSDRTVAGETPGLPLRAQYSCASRLVFSKLHARTGGRLRFFASGGAPLAPEIARFFHAAGLPILEGYGLTETSPVLAVNTFDDFRPGTVGKPIPGVEIRIAEDGEILARGPSIMKGYYNMPEATARALEGGWFHTGDIGHLDPDGFLVITDRKKDLIVTAGGKNVAPQPIENRLKTDKYVSEAIVIGDRRPFLIALIVPNFENLERYARYKGLEVKGVEELVAHPQVRDLLRRRVERYQADSPRHEKIRKIHLLERDLKIAEGELTPTLKVKRSRLAEDYKDVIEALYADEEGAPVPGEQTA